MSNENEKTEKTLTVDATQAEKAEMARKRRMEGAATTGKPRSGDEEIKDANDEIARLTQLRKDALVAQAKAARLQQVDERKKLRELEKKVDSELVLVELTHGSYVDNQHYTHDDADKPPAIKGDFIEVTMREAKRLVREKVAEIIAA